MSWLEPLAMDDSATVPLSTSSTTTATQFFGMTQAPEQQAA